MGFVVREIHAAVYRSLRSIRFPDLLDPLARLIANSSERSQIWLVTHSEQFADALEKYGKIKPLTVLKRAGETWIEGLKLIGSFREDEDSNPAIGLDRMLLRQANAPSLGQRPF